MATGAASERQGNGGVPSTPPRTQPQEEEVEERMDVFHSAARPVCLGQVSSDWLTKQILTSDWLTGVPNWSDDQRQQQQQQQQGGGSAANWSDSLPRKALFLNQTNSLPRRDKAGLGRPEPSKQSALVKDPSAKDKRDLSLERSNPFRDAILGGRLYFRM